MFYYYNVRDKGYNRQVKTLSTIILLVCLIAVPSVSTAQSITIGGFEGLNPDDSLPEYSILLAISGGGARGIADIGILKAFQEKGIRVRAIAGTSMGGIIGGLFAAGYTPAQLTALVKQIDFADIFSNRPSRSTMFQTQRRNRGQDILSLRFDGLKPQIPQGLTSAQKLTSLLTLLTSKATYQSSSNFLKLPIPFRTVSTEVVTGQTIVLDSGSLADAMRATISFPLAFTGLEVNGFLLMDGGMVVPIPVELVREMSDSVDFVVAINTTSPLVPKDRLITPVDIASQVTSIMTADKLQSSLKNADIVITPVNDEILAGDFEMRDSLLQLGYVAGLKTADSIITLHQQKTEEQPFLIDSILLDSSLKRQKPIFEKAFYDAPFTKSTLTAKLKELTRTLDLFELTAQLSPLVIASEETVANLSLTGIESIATDSVGVSFIGNHVITDKELYRLFHTEKTRLNYRTLQQFVNRIRQYYLSRGYDHFGIRKINFDNTTHNLTIFIDEAIIQNIEIAGVRRTRPWYIKAQFPLKKGEPYSSRLASQGIDNIYGTDLFKRVTVDIVPSVKGATVKIRVEEKSYHQMRFGMHWDDEYDNEEFLELLDDNIAGIGLEGRIHAQHGPDRQYYYASLNADRIFATYLTGQIRTFHRQIDRHLYNENDSLYDIRDETRTGFDFKLGQQISRLGTVSAGMIIEHVDYHHLNSDSKDSFKLHTLRIESRVENFDRYPFPNSGKQHLIEVHTSGEYIGSDVNFTRFLTSIEAYFPLTDKINYHPKLAVGVSRSDLPPTEQFYLGGLHSFSGLHTYQLRGDKLFHLSQELRFKLPLWFYLTGRYDFGDIFGRTDEIKFSALRHGFGLYLALDSPAGPLEFGYGITTNNHDRWYLSLGFEF